MAKKDTFRKQSNKTKAKTIKLGTEETTITAETTTNEATTTVDSNIILGFFQKCFDYFEDENYEGSYDYIKGMIEEHSDIVSWKCPGGVGKSMGRFVAREEWEGLTILECVLASADGPRAALRDLAEDVLVCKGRAVATELCYSLLYEMEAEGPGLDTDVMVVLVSSGFMPLKFPGKDSFLLDDVFDSLIIHGEYEQESMMGDIVKVLLGKVKAGDHRNFEKLPKLQEGVTHIAGGEFAEYLDKYQKNMCEFQNE